MMRYLMLTMAAGLGLLLSVGTAYAQQTQIFIEEEETEFEPQPMGFGVSVGGGIQGFTNGTMQNLTQDVGGAWEARMSAGLRNMIGFEGAYIGSAQSIDALGLDDDAVLLGTGIEGNLRVNFTPNARVQPFAIAGLGWKRYDLTNEDFNTSNVQDSDALLELPVGLGVAYRFEPIFVEARGTYRAAIADDELVAGGDEDADLHNWSAVLRAGWEF